MIGHDARHVPSITYDEVDWSGTINFGLNSIPIKLFNPVRHEGVSFNQLDDRNMGRIRHQKISEDTGDEVPSDNIVKGFEVSTQKPYVPRGSGVGGVAERSVARYVMWGRQCTADPHSEPHDAVLVVGVPGIPLLVEPASDLGSSLHEHSRLGTVAPAWNDRSVLATWPFRSSSAVSSPKYQTLPQRPARSGRSSAPRGRCQGRADPRRPVWTYRR
jgi:Ku70/Ku80 beta-barrel domain